MKLSRHLYYFAASFFLLKACCANETDLVLCDGAVLNTIVADLRELHRKFDLLESRFSNTNQNFETTNTKQTSIDSAKEYETVVLLTMLSDTIKNIRQSQLEDRLIAEKRYTDLKQMLHEEIATKTNLQDKKPTISVINDNNTKSNSEDRDTHTIHSTVDRSGYYKHYSFKNCTEALDAAASSGVYNFQSEDNDIFQYKAYCLLDDYGGLGWTVIQRRQDGSVSFYRDWYRYKHGFGDPNGEYWLGLEKIYALTSKQKYELWIHLGDFEGEWRHAKYSAFEIGNEEEKYYLKSLGEYTGTAGDSLHSTGEHRQFFTFDEKNNKYSYENCIMQSHLDAWWTLACDSSSINGEYNNTNYGSGVNWDQWHGSRYSLKYAHMAIRPYV